EAPLDGGFRVRVSGPVLAAGSGHAGPHLSAGRPGAGADSDVAEQLSERRPVMPVVPMQQLLKHAFDHRYGVGAFNIVDWVTMDAVLSAAAETASPVIVQVSVKTVKVMGAKLIRVMFEEMAGRVPIPATLHLDHCPDRKVIEECVAAGWNSVLF